MPIQGPPGTDPIRRENGLSAARGFTVIELMITIAVIAVAVSLALPSYRALIEKRQVTSGAEQLTAFLSSAQLEAVKRNRDVAIRCSLAAESCETFELGDNDSSTADDLSLRIVNFCGDSNSPSCGANIKADVDAIDYGGDDSEVIFDPVRGMLDQSDIVGVPMQIQLSSRQDMYALNLQLSATGAISMCSDLVRGERSVPGVPAC